MGGSEYFRVHFADSTTAKTANAKEWQKLKAIILKF